MKVWTIIIIALFALLFAAGLKSDVPVAGWIHDSGFGDRLKRDWPHLLWTVRIFGKFHLSTVPIAIILVLFGSRWFRPAALVLLSGLFSGSNSLIKWIVGRHRPFVRADVFHLHPFFGGLRGLGGPNLSFPSGDVCLAAATAASLGLIFPRWRIACVAMVLLVAAERIAEGAHYPSDTVAGAALGWGVALIAWKILGKPRGPAPALEISSLPPDNRGRATPVLDGSTPRKLTGE